MDVSWTRILRFRHSSNGIFRMKRIDRLNAHSNTQIAAPEKREAANRRRREMDSDLEIDASPRQSRARRPGAVEVYEHREHKSTRIAHRTGWGDSRAPQDEHSDASDARAIGTDGCERRNGERSRDDPDRRTKDRDVWIA